ncbi:glycerophosphodiester phosphodiesterase [Lentibacillus sediminis]|uniref:glycerophosphodiester phosphodiesterase n=1 Tax=Lentibacillus sediminis TaxID=1940529 RepID=UPI000C1C4AEF|nr:glycerophosphodiester phosphodiesterase [Lentibacillus sediminis]
MNTEIFAHRGASQYAPENTMPAFDLAWKMQADGIETDVQLTKDGVPVLIHDERLERTTDGAGYVNNFTFKELRTLDAGTWFEEKFSGTLIPSLDEMLGWIQGKPLYLNIELKNNKIDYEHLEAIVIEKVRHYQLLNRTILSTFNPDSVIRLRPFNHEVEVAYLTSKRNKFLASAAKDLGANALHIKYRLLTPRLREACQREQMNIRVYTVNHPAHVHKCLEYKCHGIFTDVPDVALRLREQY